MDKPCSASCKSSQTAAEAAAEMAIRGMVDSFAVFGQSGTKTRRKRNPPNGGNARRERKPERRLTAVSYAGITPTGSTDSAGAVSAVCRNKQHSDRKYEVYTDLFILAKDCLKIQVFMRQNTLKGIIFPNQSWHLIQMKRTIKGICSKNTKMKNIKYKQITINKYLN